MGQDFLSDDLKAQMDEALTLQLRHLSSEDEELRRTAVQAVLTLVGAQHREHRAMRSSAGWLKGD
jgi:hypothetical protein